MKTFVLLILFFTTFEFGKARVLDFCVPSKELKNKNVKSYEQETNSV
jgi:hypothetical protein